MTTINIYLTFDGNCEEAFSFYKSIFGGAYDYISRFSEMPAHDDYPLREEDHNRIMHVSLPISKETILMGSDCAGEKAKHFKEGNNFSISVHVDTKEEADRFCKGLSEGGSVNMPMNETFWGSYFGMLTDKFGINWMINCNLQPKS
jgi:PhnB protein